MAVLVYLLFGGLFVSNEAIPSYMHWVQFFTPIYYAYEAMAVNEFDGTTVLMKASACCFPLFIFCCVEFI